MDATVRSEEKFNKLSIAYEGEEEAKFVCETVDAITKKHGIQPETYTCKISGGKNILVIEYQDDETREVGDIFEEILKALDVKVID